MKWKRRNIIIRAFDILPPIVSTGVSKFSVALPIEPGESIAG